MAKNTYRIVDTTPRPPKRVELTLDLSEKDFLTLYTALLGKGLLGGAWAPIRDAREALRA